MLNEPAAKPKETAPDFGHVDTWIFDLDNTLYPATSDLFAQIDAKMTAYVQALSGLAYKSTTLCIVVGITRHQ